MRKYRKIALTAAMILIMSVTVTAFAANEAYSFTMNTPIDNTIRYIYTATSNRKFYNQQDGTIRCTTQNAPGLGYHIGLTAKIDYSAASYPQWMKTGQMKNTPFYAGKGVVDAYFHASGRYDNDYTGQYSISGTYNADIT